MSEDDDDLEGEDGDDDGEDAEGEGEESSRKFSGKKLVLFIGLPLVLIIGGVAAAFFLGVFGSDEPEMAETDEVGEHAEDDAHAAPAQVVFYDLPEMLVNLNTRGNQTSYLKIRVSLELDDPAAVERLDALQPRIIDNFQVYLRELRAEDPSGSAGVYRLKEELLARVNTAVKPVKVTDVLFREMLVQ